MPAVVPATPRRLAFLGTPAVAAGTLRALVAAGFEVAVVVTRADKRRSRGGGAEPSPVKATAIDLGLPVTTKVDDVIDAAVDLGVVVAFGQLVKPHVLDAVPMVNVHFSLLPRWRGAAPVERAILAGDTETGVCLMQLEEGLDTGPVFACERMAVDDRVTADELRAELGEIGSRLLVDALTRRAGHAHAARRRSDVRGEDRLGRPRDRLDAPRRRDRTCGASRTRMDDVPRQPAARDARRAERRSGR